MHRVLSPIRTARNVLCTTTRSAVVLTRSGVLGPYAPWRVARLPASLLRAGVGLGSLYDLHRALHPDRTAVDDDGGRASFAAMAERVEAAASGLADRGLEAGQTVAVLCRNHRDFLVAIGALARLGVDIVYLNTGFAGPQLAEVAEREGVAAVILDAEFLELAATVASGRRLIVVEEPARPTVDEVDGIVSWRVVVAAGAGRSPGRPPRTSRQIVLTSGTTGSPKGARRSVGRDIDPVLSLLSRIPLRSSDTTVLAAPMFHSWGLANAAFALVLGAELVLPRRFDPEDTLRLIEAHRATVLAAVPVMIQRIMALPPEVRDRYDTSSLRVVGLSGSALPGELALRFMDRFGDVVYNVYGSTEVGWASIANPADLRAAPGTAGQVPLGTDVVIVDDDGTPVAPGTPGRIFVRSGLAFDGYTGGGGKEQLDGYLSSGDVGHFDARGRLFVDGRDDDMIVSGGENVFPREVEDLLADHPDVVEAAVIGVPDDEFGQRLIAFVVAVDGAEVDGDDLKDHVRQHLARYKVPRSVSFLDQLPRNTTGKVVKRDLIPAPG
jgi:acyl-CoA synthetase (AMP-forming)/AMP-acid ligase II